jgi:type III secretion protein V
MPSTHSTLLLDRPKLRSSGAADAVLAALVIGVVGLMVVPLPTWLLDLLIAANLAISITVLLVTLYVTDALKVAAFPTLLLITTLFRLALNVSSTRLILLQADAGHMIRAFGSFVVRGNYVVGGVIFLILSIKFVVIAKGSERVAEVGARFALDAMPGKQMAIDAELRSGAIDGPTAKRRRNQLSRESQFYGAMDGAMKFVKGDVIATFIITLVNIIGGLSIGVGQHNMPVVAALKKYGLLTIGDGLVTQIPALLLSTAAGILVTRVASEDEDSALGSELSSQLMGSPKALQVAGGFVVALGIVPGLPLIPLWVIGGALFFLGRLPPSKAAELTVNEPVQRESRSNPNQRFVPVVIPWSIAVSPDLAAQIEDEVRGDRVIRPGLRSASNAIRELVFRQLGVPLPACVVRVDPQLSQRELVMSLHEVPSRILQLPEPLTAEDSAQFIVDALLPTLIKRAPDFLGIAETQLLLDRLEQIAPATVRQVVPKPLSLPTLTDVLRRLVEEGVNVRDLKAILESVAQVAQTDKDPLNLAEYVRSQLRRAMTFRVTEGSESLSVILLASEVEETIRSAISRTSAGSFLTLAPSAAREIAAATRRCLSKIPPGTRTRVVLATQPDVRRFARKLVELEFPDLVVISFAELLPEVTLHPVGTITIRELPKTDAPV